MSGGQGQAGSAGRMKRTRAIPGLAASGPRREEGSRHGSCSTAGPGSGSLGPENQDASSRRQHLGLLPQPHSWNAPATKTPHPCSTRFPGSCWPHDGAPDIHGPRRTALRLDSVHLLHRGRHSRHRPQLGHPLGCLGSFQHPLLEEALRLLSWSIR